MSNVSKFGTRSSLAVLVLLAASALLPPRVSAEIREFYVGADVRPLVTFGAYQGEPNPNLNRLTLLFAHPNEENPVNNHFHGIGAYSYTGTKPNHVAISTNTNNRIPETFTGLPPLSLVEGTGAWEGKLISQHTSEEYSDLAFNSIHDLASFVADSPEGYLYNSSGKGYQGDMTGVQLAFELVSKTPGLGIGTEGNQHVLGLPGQRYSIANLPFLPVFWTDETAAPGKYSAEMRLVDLSGKYAPSGTFNFDFSVVPEPGLWGAAILALPLLLQSCRRR